MRPVDPNVTSVKGVWLDGDQFAEHPISKISPGNVVPATSQHDG